jgi:hypothetical protein
MSALSTAPSSTPKKAAGGGIYLALVPWVAFALIARFSVQAAALAALAGAVAIAAPSIRRHNAKTLELAAVAAFVGIAAAAFLLDASAADWVARYARGIAAGFLALIAFGSLLSTPFTEQYARESVPARFWLTPQFRALNQKLTLTWGFVFIAMVPCHIAAGLIDTTRSNLVFNWAIPAALGLWGIKRTSALSLGPATQG